MKTALIVITAVPLLPLALILILLGKLRRRGRPDRTAEWYLGTWAVFSTARLVAEIWWDGLPGWLWWPLMSALILAGFVFLGWRIRQHPEAVLSPETIARIRGAAAKLRR